MVCPKCHSPNQHIVKIGSVNTVKKGQRQRFKCQDCARTFYNKEEGIK